jgi:hypothetical protein
VSSQSKESSRTNRRTRKQHTVNNTRHNNHNACHQDTSSSSVITLKGRSIRIVLECWGWERRGHVDMNVSTVPLGGYKHMHTWMRASWPGGQRKEEWTMENLEDGHRDTCSSVTQRWLSIHSRDISQSIHVSHVDWLITDSLLLRSKYH